MCVSERVKGASFSLSPFHTFTKAMTDLME